MWQLVVRCYQMRRVPFEDVKSKLVQRVIFEKSTVYIMLCKKEQQNKITQVQF